MTPSSNKRSAPASSAATKRRSIRSSAPKRDGAAPERSIVRVLCVDDHTIVVDGLKAQFAVAGDIEVVGALPSADALLESVIRLDPDVVLLDIEMPGADAFETADRVRHLHPRSRIVFLSAHTRDSYISAAYRCGACGYYAKGDDPEAIVAGIREVARSAGGTFLLGPKVRERCGPTDGSRPADAGANAPRTPKDALSSREVEVLRLIGKGLTRTQVAAELGRSVKTVDGHQDRLLRKLGLATRAELLRYALREGFAET